jgi:broad specificity phosphatase PhoE
MNETHIDGSRKNGALEALLVRHGQSTANATGVWQGQLDFPLSELGRRQAAEAGRALKGVPLSGVYASPLSRAFETAEILAGGAGYSGEVVPIPGLMERHGGVLEGRTWAEQETRDPEFARKFLSIPEEERWAMADAETDEQVLLRFEEAMASILARHRDEAGGRVVVVSHGGVMRAYLRDRFGPDILPGTRRAANASITRLLLERDDASARLLDLASTEHLTVQEGSEPRKGAESL